MRAMILLFCLLFLSKIFANDSYERDIVTVGNVSIALRCRIIVGIPKSGTTWIMNLLYTYLLGLTGSDMNHRSLLFAQGHVKRADFSCQYEWGEKRRSMEDFNTSSVELAYRLLPAFSHVVRNNQKKGNADKSVAKEQIEFERFFGIRRDRERALVEPGPVKAGHKFAHSGVVRPHHYDTRCMLAILIREPISQALSACYYYDGICGGVSGEANLTNIKDVPSHDRQSLMVPLNATIRWNRALANTLSGAIFGPPSLAELKSLSRCPRFPFSDPRTITQNNTRHFGRRFVDDSSNDDDDDDDDQEKNDDDDDESTNNNNNNNNVHNENDSHHRKKPHENAKELMKMPALLLFLRKLHFLTYDQLKRNARDTLRQLLVFFEFPLDERLLDETVRVVASRPATDIKYGFTPARVDVFTQDQMRYVDELCRTHDPFFVDVLDVLDSGNTLLNRSAALDNDMHHVATTATVDLSKLHDDVVGWRYCSNVTELLFENDTCHRLWEARLLSARIANLSDVKLDVDRGVATIRFSDQTHGWMELCEQTSSSATANNYGRSSWKAMIIAHAIDRLLAIHRVPAVVPRVLRIATVDSVASSRLRSSCQRSQSTFVGALSGGVEILETAASAVSMNPTMTFDLSTGVTSEALEWMRERIGKFVMQPSELRTVEMIGTMMHVHYDTHSAHWTRDSQQQLRIVSRLGPFCDRTPTSIVFRCDHQHSLEMRAFTSIIHNACVFPREIATRLLRLSAMTRGRASYFVQAYVAEHLRIAVSTATAADASVGDFQLWPTFSPFTTTLWNASVFDQRVSYAAYMLRKCISTYGHDNVIF